MRFTCQDGSGCKSPAKHVLPDTWKQVCCRHFDAFVLQGPTLNPAMPVKYVLLPGVSVPNANASHGDLVHFFESVHPHYRVQLGFPCSLFARVKHRFAEVAGWISRVG